LTTRRQLSVIVPYVVLVMEWKIFFMVYISLIDVILRKTVEYLAKPPVMGGGALSLHASMDVYSMCHFPPSCAVVTLWDNIK
jgi:hypothetical protein